MNQGWEPLLWAVSNNDPQIWAGVRIPGRACYSTDCWAPAQGIRFGRSEVRPRNVHFWQATRCCRWSGGHTEKIRSDVQRLVANIPHGWMRYGYDDISSNFNSFKMFQKHELYLEVSALHRKYKSPCLPHLLGTQRKRCPQEWAEATMWILVSKQRKQ